MKCEPHTFSALKRAVSVMLLYLLTVVAASTNCDHTFRNWLAARGNDTFTRPHIVNKLLPLMVGTTDPGEPVLAPIIDLLDTPFNWSGYIDSSLKCASAVPEINEVMCLVGEATPIVDPTSFLSDVIDFGVLMERFTAASALSPSYHRLWYNKMRAQPQTKKISLFAYFKGLAVDRGMSLIAAIRENRTGFFRGARMNLVLGLNIWEALIAQHVNRHHRNERVGGALLRLRDVIDNKMFRGEDGQFVDSHSREWNIVYFLWNLLLINNGNFREGFAFINAKWLVPSVLCNVESETMFSTRVPALEQYMVFNNHPSTMSVPPSILGTGARTFWANDTLLAWEDLVVRWVDHHKDQLHKRRRRNNPKNTSKKTPTLSILPAPYS
jgi:hypothetical protein